MTPLRILLTLLLLAALLLAAGCVSQGLDNQNHTLPEGKYILLRHITDYNYVPVSGACPHIQWSMNTAFHFNETTGVLTPDYNEDQYNDSLILFYFSETDFYGNGEKDARNPEYRGNGHGVYSLPSNLSGRATLDSVSGDGTVALRFNDLPIVLKPKERWMNKTRRTYLCDTCYFQTNDPSPECSEESIITDIIYNAGVFDKSAIKVRETYQYTPVKPNRTASEWMRTYNNNLTPAEKKIPYEILQFIDADYPKEYISFTKKELAAGYNFIPEENASLKFNISEKTAREHGGEINVRIDLEPTASLDVVDPYATRIEGRDERTHSVLAWVGLNTIGEIASLAEVKEIRPIIPPITFSR